MKIVKVEGFELLDSRSNPTVGAGVFLEDGSYGFAISPSGASTGMYEAHELRDGDKRYNGKGVLKAVNNINTCINDCLRDMDAFDQKAVDMTMIKCDGTENKSKLGANAILAVSLAVAKASAASFKMPLYRYLGGIYAKKLPIPMMNIINGGAHASNNVDIQEFMIMPYGCETFTEALRVCSQVYHKLGKILKEKNLLSGVGDEGGFAPNLESDEHAIELILEAVHKEGFSNEIKIALDAASSEWYEKGEYFLPKRKARMNSNDLIEYYSQLINKYPIISIEDGLSENDWDGWKNLTKKLGDKIQLVGDDLFVTNTKKLQQGIQQGIGNSILIKPNQIGTLRETFEGLGLAKSNGYATGISHRSGETEDTTIADIAVGVNAGQIKTGAPARTDRTAKYNRLLMIEKNL